MMKAAGKERGRHVTSSIWADDDGSVHLRLPDKTCRDWSQAIAHEWLVTNGRGSYASGTVAGTNTRRYHGLLVAALRPPLGRTLLVAALDATVEPAVSARHPPPCTSTSITMAR